jgi:lipopolysaccharide/colanic/teichoic acid biosynthesis glycosyltransferase
MACGKRIFDLTVSIACLVLLLPVMAVIALLVRATSAGPALFRQTRIGYRGRPFVMLKFRTMYRDSSDAVHRELVTAQLTEARPVQQPNHSYKLTGDTRVTPLGRFLRRTSLDELPQLLNVVRGEMSIVGPRPALPWEVELYEPEHHRRFLVPPGVTGLWQVSGRNDVHLKKALDLDLDYVERQSFRLDLEILARTVPAVLTPTRDARDRRAGRRHLRRTGETWGAR